MEEMDFGEFLRRSQVEWQARWLKLSLWLKDQCMDGRTEFVARLINVDPNGYPGAIVIESANSADCVQISLQDS